MLRVWKTRARVENGPAQMPGLEYSEFLHRQRRSWDAVAAWVPL
jgi:hypothetical protein